MERLMFTMQIRAGQEAEYDRRHAAVWPELMADLRAAGWRNYSLFRRGPQVCAYAECHPDVDTALAAMAGSAANARWAAWFDEVLEVLTGPDGELVRMAEVWHLPESADGHLGNLSSTAASSTAASSTAPSSEGQGE